MWVAHEILRYLYRPIRDEINKHNDSSTHIWLLTEPKKNYFLGSNGFFTQGVPMRKTEQACVSGHSFPTYFASNHNFKFR
jgi:hypothetical protein